MVSCISTARGTLWMRGRAGIRSLPPSRRPITGCVVLARPVGHARNVMAASRWSVEQVLWAVRDLPPEAQREVLSRLPSVLALSTEEVDWLHLAEPAFAFWDNAEDAAYDAL